MMFSSLQAITRKDGIGRWIAVMECDSTKRNWWPSLSSAVSIERPISFQIYTLEQPAILTLTSIECMVSSETGTRPVSLFTLVLVGGFFEIPDGACMRVG